MQSMQEAQELFLNSTVETRLDAMPAFLFQGRQLLLLWYKCLAVIDENATDAYVYCPCDKEEYE